MRQVVTDVQERLGELEAYLRFLKELDRAPRFAREKLPSLSSASAVLKANTFLILYNIVEGCVRASFSQTYSEIVASGCAYKFTTESIRSVWLRQQMDVPADSANHQTYMNLAARIVQTVADSEVMNIEARKLPVSGNLDADAVRLICAKHGIELRVPRWARGGAELQTIKDQRNALAHGHKSFSECGREYGVADLTRIYKQTRYFLSGFMRSVESFNARRGYRSSQANVP